MAIDPSQVDWPIARSMLAGRAAIEMIASEGTVEVGLEGRAG